MTNGDWIRSLTDEELAAFLDHAIEFPCDSCCNNLMSLFVNTIILIG